MLQEVGKNLEGFKSSSEASACAARMTNVWQLRCKSYTNLKTGEFGVVRIADKVAGVKELTEAEKEAAEAAAAESETIGGDGPVELPGGDANWDHVGTDTTD
jgi:hypothetical protein